MHNEPTLQTPREKPLPTTASAAVATVNGTGAIPTPENTNRTPLHEAASTGDEAKVETLLAAGADRNAKESVHGNTPLHEASWKGYSRCVKLLCALPKPAKVGGASGAKGLELLKDAVPAAPSSSSAKIKHGPHDTKGALHSALLGTRNFGGFSALHLAAQNGHNQSCREILLAGGDPDVQNNYGDSPLHTACRYGHAGAIRILLSAKCDFERINLNGDTALHIACAMGRRKLTRILLESGCRQDTKNAQDETARDIAQRKNLVEIINILNSPPPPPAPAPAAPNTVDLSPRRSRERSSSSSHRKAADCPDGHGRSSRPSKPVAGAGEEGPAHRKSGRRRSNSNDDAKGGGAGAEVDPKHWSPYGCHYFPDPRNFPSPKLETLPKEPLGNGEQYFLDLAGNIRKGPVGVGNTCYCAPFFKHLEARMNQNRRSIRKYVHRATEKLDSRMTALAMRTDDQIEELTKSMIASRVQCENKRLHLEQWLKRGIAERSTTTTSGGGGGAGHPLQHTNSKTKKDEANTNTLTRCRSLELLDDHEDHHHHHLQAQQSTPVAGAVNSIPTKQLFSSRSIDFLDATGSTVDEEAHLRLLQYGSATGHQSDAFGGSSQHSNMKNHSDAASETPPLPPLGRRNRSASICYSSDKDNDREKPPSLAPQPQPTTSGHQGKSEKAKVTERLEELLSKTKRILELEKLTKATGPGSPPVATARSDNRYILALDKLRDIHHYDPPLAGTAGGRGHSPGAAGYDIAQEMEKITKSLLPATALDTAAAPVSPEIAKDITTRKERPTAVYGLALAYGPPVCSASQSGSPFVVDEEESHLGRTNFGHAESPGAGVVVNGFYSNSCFADETLPSSSCNTTIKRAPGTDPEEDDSPDEEGEEEQDSDGGDDDGDDQRDSESDRADLSAMANLAELKELKSRILNGTNWRSQVLQKSVQELLLREDRTQDESPMAEDRTSGDDPTTDTNRVRYIISKLQQSVAGGGHSNPPPLAQCEDFSDSSEDEGEEDEHHGGNGGEAEEDDDDEDCVDGPLPVGRHHSDGGTTTTTIIIPGAVTGKVEIGIGTAKSLIQMYEQSSSSSAAASGSSSKALPTIQGIPKDAYFHDLPRKPALGGTDRDEDTPPPMALASRSRNPLPSYLLQEAELFQQHQQQQPGPYRATSMMLNGNEGFLHHPTPPAPSQRYNHHHHHPHQSNAYQSYHQVAAQPPPESERLLSTRKYINPAATQHQQRSLSSTATPSPEFPLYHQQQQPAQQAQPQHSALGTATGVGTVIAGHSHAMMTMMAAAAAAAASRSKSADNLSNDDSGYVSGKVSEIHVPSGGASPLLSLPAGLANGTAGGNVLIIPPPASASPRHFLPSYPHHHHHHHHLGMTGNGGGSVVTSIVPPPAPLGSGPPAPMTSAAAHAAVEQKQQSLYKLGASSLV